MPTNLHVRNVPDEIARRIKVRAAENGRSAEAEHRAALAKVYGQAADKDMWLERAAKLRKETRGQLSVRSEDIVREMRDSE
jgi:plasmid stability protein